MFRVVFVALVSLALCRDNWPLHTNDGYDDTRVNWTSGEHELFNRRLIAFLYFHFIFPSFSFVFIIYQFRVLCRRRCDDSMRRRDSTNKLVWTMKIFSCSHWHRIGSRRKTEMNKKMHNNYFIVCSLHLLLLRSSIISDDPLSSKAPLPASWLSSACVKLMKFDRFVRQFSATRYHIETMAFVNSFIHRSFYSWNDSFSKWTDVANESFVMWSSMRPTHFVTDGKMQLMPSRRVTNYRKRQRERWTTKSPVMANWRWTANATWYRRRDYLLSEQMEFLKWQTKVQREKTKII